MECRRKSFTLIELLVVIAIIGILSSLVIARFSDWNDNARTANTLQWSSGVHKFNGPDMVGVWNFNDEANPMKDISGNGHNLTSTSPPSLINGISNGKAFSFNGSTDYLLTSSNVNLYETERGISGMFWVYSLVSQEQTMLMHGGGNWPPRYGGWFVEINQSRSLRLYTGWWSGVGGDGSFIHNSSAGSIPANKWTHIAFSLHYEEDVDTTYMKGWINGELIISESLVGKYLDNVTSKPIVIGARTHSAYPANPPISNFNGYIDDVQLYNTRLSTGDVFSYYQNSSYKYLAHE